MQRDQMQVAVLVLAGLFHTAPIQAQQKIDPTDPSVFKVEFSIRDNSDASGKGNRHYAMLINSNGKGTFRSGSRIPYSTGATQTPGSGISQQYTYLDLGVIIDCRVRELANNRVVLNADIEISTLAPPDKSLTAATPNPTIGTVRIGIDAVVNSGKPTVVGSIDDPVAPRKFDIEALVTRAN